MNAPDWGQYPYVEIRRCYERLIDEAGPFPVEVADLLGALGDLFPELPRP